MFSVRSFRVETVEFRHDRLRRGSPPLAMAHISDLHLRQWGPQHDLLVEALRPRGLDFVFLTGDFLTNRPDSLGCLQRLVEQLQCRYGLFACRGNWEVGCAPPLRWLRTMMDRWGACLLVNDSRTVTTHAGRVRIVGLDDMCSGWPDFEAAFKAAAGPSDLTVLLSHAPLAAVVLPEGHGVDLVLSGHTHGGQVRIPFLWRGPLPCCHGGFSDGLYELGALRLHVTRGFGGVGIVPLRFNCPAQVALLRVLAPVCPAGGSTDP